MYFAKIFLKSLTNIFVCFPLSSRETFDASTLLWVENDIGYY